MKVELKEHVCVVTREPGDPRFTGDGNAAGESRLLYHVLLELKKQGHDVIKKRMGKDGHLVDDCQQYVRTRNKRSPQPHVAIYSGFFTLRGANDDFNQKGEVELDVVRDIFGVEKCRVRDAIVDAVARVFFVSSWADTMENYGGKIPPGSRLYDIAPKTPRIVREKFGVKFVKELLWLNNCYVQDLWDAAQVKVEGNPHRKTPTLDDLGYCLAMEAMGSGVAWTDDHPPLRPRHRDLVLPPEFEFETPFESCNISHLLPAKVRHAFQKEI